MRSGAAGLRGWRKADGRPRSCWSRDATRPWRRRRLGLRVAHLDRSDRVNCVIAVEQTGVIAVINGVVGNNTHRKLNVDEFRGFALCDAYAPLIFVNGADAKSAQMFTLAHELAHLWVGDAGEGVSAFENISPGGTEVENFCDGAAAEFLLPAQELKTHWNAVKRDPQPFMALARRFKVSPIVVGRRAMDMRLVDRESFFAFYHEYVNRERKQTSNAGGGDFYQNQNARVGRIFAKQVIRAAKEGRLNFREAL